MIWLGSKKNMIKRAFNFNSRIFPGEFLVFGKRWVAVDKVERIRCGQLLKEKSCCQKVL